MALIGISGKIGSGKDTIGQIIQYLFSLENGSLANHQMSFEDFKYTPNSNFYGSGFEIKKFADELKNQVCSLIDCTREDLENIDFKNKELGEEWWYWKLNREGGYSPILISYPASEEELMQYEGLILIKPTPRMLLQQIGTDLFRNQLHPNVWVNALMSKYKLKSIGDLDNGLQSRGVEFPNWIITDMRFPNELKAVKDRGGITIRVERHVDENNKPIKRENEHESETALDNIGFDYLIHNNGSIQTLIHEVREILILEGYYVSQIN